MPEIKTITEQQGKAADALLAALETSAELAEDRCEGSEGHLRDEAAREARTDLHYLREYPTSPLLALNAGGFLTIEDWLHDNAAVLARWHEAK